MSPEQFNDEFASRHAIVCREGKYSSQEITMPDVPPGVDPYEYMRLEMIVDGVSEQRP